MKRFKNPQQIHIRCDLETRKKWLAFCESQDRTTQSVVFKNLIDKIYDYTDLKIENNEK